METGDLMYILPQYRFTSYAFGVYVGVLLSKSRGVKFSSTQLYSLLTVAFSVLIVSLRLAAELTDENYKYNSLHAALMTFLPIPFCIFFALIILSAELGVTSELIVKILNDMKNNLDHSFSDFFTDILEWRGFRITTKLSYSFYLVQFVVFYYNTGVARGSNFYSLIKTGVN